MSAHLLPWTAQLKIPTFLTGNLLLIIFKISLYTEPDKEVIIAIPVGYLGNTFFTLLSSKPRAISLFLVSSKIL